jgi:hypothetical protein
MFPLLTIVALCVGTAIPAAGSLPGSREAGTVSILCYLNGDNDLSQEVLYALDMLETIGSSDRMQVIALVDGHPRWLGSYDRRWASTHLLRVTSDAQIGVINSEVLEEWGEADMGCPDTLERFIRRAVTRFPADRYLFYSFAHSQGIIDTRRLTLSRTPKTVSISRDTTSTTTMCLNQFHDAIKTGLNGRRFDLMVLFSCLANMVEIAYALSDITHYLVASEDEIRLLNQPPGSYQIRGLEFERIVAMLHRNPATDACLLGRNLVDFHVDSYCQDTLVETAGGVIESYRYAADMAMVDCGAMPDLVRELDQIAGLMIAHADDSQVMHAMHKALAETPRFASFLNLEYYDLQRFVWHLRKQLHTPTLLQACDRAAATLAERVLVYDRRTQGSGATGISVYLSNPLVPDNIYRSHQRMYARSQFGRDTLWDEMINCFRQRLR